MLDPKAVRSCPHCGGWGCITQEWNGSYYVVYIKCDICGARGKSYRSTEEPIASSWGNSACQAAVKAWNMRTG